MQTIRSKNKGVIFGKREYDIHLLVKILIQKKLLERGSKEVYAEYPFSDRINQKVRILDIVDFDNNVIYEIERKPSKKYILELNKFAENTGMICQVIDLSKINKNEIESIEKLIKYLEGCIV